MMGTFTAVRECLMAFFTTSLNIFRIKSVIVRSTQFNGMEILFQYTLMLLFATYGFNFGSSF